MIDLGLSRVTALLGALGNPQNYYRSVHVAGTNGKGSVVSYISSILTTNNVCTGKFTSPHLIHEFDAININDKTIQASEYNEVRKVVEQLNTTRNIGATEFEKQTASAFELFRRFKVDVAVIEVGLGGLLDATNVLSPSNVLCTAITKIAIDHESFLGTTLPEIARHKAGIIKQNVPCVVDGSNDSQVLDVVKSTTQAAHSELFPVTGMPDPLKTKIEAKDILQGDFQMQNAAVAVQTVLVGFPDIDLKTIIKGLQQTRWPGRLERREVNGVTVLVDGAHNNSSAMELAAYVDKNVRPNGTGAVRWVVAFSKPSRDILTRLVHEGDLVTATQFDAVDGMPWIKAQDPDVVAEVARSLTVPEKVTVQVDPRQVDLQGSLPVVICGSLYLLQHYLDAP